MAEMTCVYTIVFFFNILEMIFQISHKYTLPMKMRHNGLMSVDRTQRIVIFANTILLTIVNVKTISHVIIIVLCGMLMFY